jgi:hypothetical protein
MVTCPKCKTDNSDDAMNCKFCTINLAYAISHPELFEEKQGQKDREFSQSRVGEVKELKVATGNNARKLSPAIFGIVIICFFLPFVNVTCQGQKVASFSGFQLVGGTTIEQSGGWGGKQVRNVSGEPLALFAFLATIAGLALSFYRRDKSAIAPAAVSGIGLILLLVLKSKLDSDILKQGGGMLQLEYSVGFWMAFILYLAAMVLNGFIFSQGKREIGKQG